MTRRHLPVLNQPARTPPTPAVPEERPEDVAAGLLIATSNRGPTSTRKPIVLAAFATSAAALVIAIILQVLTGKGTSPTGTHLDRSSVVAAERSAVFDRSGDDDGNELIRLSHGRLRVERTNLDATTTLRLVTDDAVVECTKATFDIEANRSNLELLTVHEGKVDMTLKQGETKQLGKGERWHAKRAQ